MDTQATGQKRKSLSGGNRFGNTVRNNEKNRWGGASLEFNEARASTSTESNRKESSQIVSSTEESEVARPAATLLIVDLKNYDIAEKTIQYIQLKRMIKKPKTVNTTETGENFNKVEFNFMEDFETLILKTSVDPKLLQLKICLRMNQKELALKKSLRFSPTKFTERFGLLIAKDKFSETEELKKQVVDALDFGHPVWKRKLTEGNILWWAGMRKDIEESCSKSTVCLSSGKKLKYQLLMTKKISLPVLTELGRETQVNFSGKLHEKHVVGEPYILIGIDRYSIWLIVRV